MVPAKETQNRLTGKNEEIYMNRKLMTAAVCCAVLALTACGGKKEKVKEEAAAEATVAVEETAKVETYTPAVHEDGKYYVGIIQQSGNESLNLASQGFQDELYELMGENVEIDYQVADGTELGCDVIVDHFLQDKDDLILAGGTLALRRAYAATKDVPIVGTGVTDFLIAGGVSSVNEPGENVTGISDLPPMESQKDFLLSVADGDTIGIVMGSLAIVMMKTGLTTVFKAELGGAISTAMMGLFVFIVNLVAGQSGNMKKLAGKMFATHRPAKT